MPIHPLVISLMPSSWSKASIIIAAFNETVSLRETLRILHETCQADDVGEILLAVSPHSTPECLAVCEDLKQHDTFCIRVVTQKLPGAGGAYRDAFQVAGFDHLILMASDLETVPHDVCRLIEESKRFPQAVICTSRWIQPARFQAGYNRFKWIANYVFQKMFSGLYGTNLTDLTFGFRLMPTALARAIAWEECRHPFFLETILKPLRLGIPTREIATGWKPRMEGDSQNPMWRNFLYFKIGLKARFANPAAMLINHKGRTS